MTSPDEVNVMNASRWSSYRSHDDQIRRDSSDEHRDQNYNKISCRPKYWGKHRRKVVKHLEWYADDVD